MSITEGIPILFETLVQARWLSFEDGWQDETRLTVWQAIAHIIAISGSASQVLQEYKSAITEAEMEMFVELFDTSDVIQILAADGSSEKAPRVRKANKVKAAQELRGWLQLLEKNRLITTEYFDTPRILYHIIQADRIAGRRSTLRFTEHVPVALLDPLTLIGKTSLDKWAASESVSMLGLIAAAEKVSSRAIRSQAFESHEKIIALFMHLIAEIFPSDFTLKNKPDNIVIDRFVKLLVGNATYRESGFPQESTCADILEKSEARYSAFVRKPEFHLPEKRYPRLRAHLKKRLASK